MPRKPRRRGHSPPRDPKGWKKGRPTQSKMVTRRLEDTRKLLSAIKTYEPYLEEGFEAKLAPELRDGESPPDLAFGLRLVGRSVERAAAALAGVDDRYARLVSECTRLCNVRDLKAGKELYQAMVTVRRTIDGIFGKVGGKRFHRIEGRIPRQLTKLLPVVEVTLRRLRSESLELDTPKPLTRGVAVDRDAWRRQLEEPWRNLDQLARELADTQAERCVVRDERDDATKAFDAAYGEALRFAEAAFAVAGLDERKMKELRTFARRRELKRRAREKTAARREQRKAATRKATKPATASDRRPVLAKMWSALSRHLGGRRSEAA